MYTCTAWAVYFHTHHSITSCTIIELLTLKLTLASLLMRGNTAFFCFKEVKATCTIHLDRNTLSSLYFVIFDCFFLTYHFFNGQNWVTRNHLFSCLCNSSVCAQQLKPMATIFALTKTSTNPQCALSHRPAFLSSYYRQL